MKVYLDVCCLNRPFDDQSQTRVRLEAEAVLSILKMANDGELEISKSDIIDDELSQTPDAERREKVELLVAAISSHISFTTEIERRASELTKCYIDPFDALHLASAESAELDFFLTTDDDLIRKARHADLKLRVENPAKWLMQKETDES